MTQRLSQRASWERLVELGAYVVPNISTIDFSPQTYVVRLDSTLERIAFFRTSVTDIALESMSLQKLDICRSLIERVSFCNSNLSNSTFCWNDFVDCDFTHVIFSGADLRASVFTRCRFAHATLNGADLRRSRLELCNFVGASMNGTLLTYDQGELLNLIGEQRRVVDWQDDIGSQPDGG